MRRPGDDEEREFEQADEDRGPFDAAIGAGADDRQQHDDGDRQRHGARKPVEFANSARR